MRFLLIRHGETDHNKQEVITGQMEIGLTRKGIQQAEKAAERLKDEKFDGVYSSDLERTYQTVKIIAEKHGMHPEVYTELREKSFGSFEGKLKDEWREAASKRKGEPHRISPENGESLKETGNRFLGKLEDLAEKHKTGEKILVGGHSVAIKATITEILGLGKNGYQKLEQSNTGITELEYKGGEWKIIRMNDYCHLEKM